MSNNHGGKRATAGRKPVYQERVNMWFPVEAETKRKLKGVTDLQDKFNAWVQSILNEQEI